MAGAIAQQPPKQRKRTKSGKFVLPLKKFAFFDEITKLLYNSIVKVKYIVDFANFSFAILPQEAKKKSKRHNTFILKGCTPCRMGRIVKEGGGR